MAAPNRLPRRRTIRLRVPSLDPHAPRPPRAAKVSEGKEEQCEPMVPGDKAQPGADNAGEDLCPRCGGAGRTEGEECENCGGAGRVWVPVGTP